MDSILRDRTSQLAEAQDAVRRVRADQAIVEMATVIRGLAAELAEAREELARVRASVGRLEDLVAAGVVGGRE